MARPEGDRREGKIMLRRCILIAGAGILVLGATATPASAQAKPNKGRCISELAKAGLIGRDTNPGQANIIVGTEGDDTFVVGQFTEGVDLVCGFGGNDRVYDADPSVVLMGPGDVFLGGDGNDSVFLQLSEGAIFVGGAGNDSVGQNRGGTVIGGDGNDTVLFNDQGTFDGGAGNDEVHFLTEGFAGHEGPSIFNGGDGDDHVRFLGNFGSSAVGPTFNGDAGNDSVGFMQSGVFNGGPGDDSVQFSMGGTFNQD
jgi:Ca2+-binding RTX toxin-like protein